MAMFADFYIMAMVLKSDTMAVAPEILPFCDVDLMTMLKLVDRDPQRRNRKL